MKVISVKKKSIFRVSVILVFVISVLMFSTTFGMQNYYKLDFVTGITTSNLNVRSGPRHRL